MDFNPITSTYSISQDPVRRDALFEEYFDVVKNEFCDLVFICTDERVSYHSDLVSLISPVIRDFVQNAKSCQCNAFIRRQVELFITLDGIHADTIELVMSSVYRNHPLKFPKADLDEVSKIFKMLGVDETLFTVDNSSKVSNIPRNHKMQSKRTKRKIPDEDFVQKRQKSLNQEGFDEERQSLVYNMTRAEQVLADQKSITMTKVAQNSNPVPLNYQPSVPSIPSSISNLPISIDKVPSSSDSNPAPYNYPSSLSSLSSAPTNRPSAIANLPPSITIHPSSSISQTGNKIQSILPHLTVSSVNQGTFEDRSTDVGPSNTADNADNMFEDNEPILHENVNSDEFGQNQPPMLHENVNSDEFGQNQPLIDQGDLKCPISYCPMGGKSFKMRSEIIMHIAHEHYKDQLLELHPWNKGASCQLCIDEQKPKIYQIPPNKKSHIMHVGVTHEVVMDLLPQELRVALEAFGPKKRGAGGGRKSKKSQLYDAEVAPSNYLGGGDAPYHDNSYPNTYDENQSGQTYGNYNYDGSTNYNYHQAPVGPIVYDSPYQNEENHPYQEMSNSYENFNNEAVKAIVNDPNQGYNVLKSHGDYEETKPADELHEGTNYSNAREAEQPATLVPNVDSEQFKESNAIGEENNLARFSNLGNSQINQGIPRKSKLQGHLTCHLCTMRSFPKKDDLMFHLTFSHFSKDILLKHPFLENQECTLCNDAPVTTTTMSSHLRHVGVVHGEVLQFLTPDIAEQIKQDDTRPVIPPMISSQPVENTVIKAEPLEQELEKTCAEVKQEVAINEQTDQEAVKSAPDKIEEKVVHQQRSSGEIPSVQCSLCPNKVRMYNKRSDFLKHLSLGHYGRNILQVHPYLDGQNCTVCQETNSKIFVPTKKEIHVCHVGVLHGKVFDYLSEELLSLVKSLPTQKKIALAKSPIKDVKVEAAVLKSPIKDVNVEAAVPKSPIKDETEPIVPQASTETPTEATLQEEVVS